ncbi:L,D-transpeptidase family protein [Flavobacterium selenitireducens]|uniref:L,D-transpeptidase family protein n=1 Tax=Flavobacterium selenitireducens TaxID=2722704 RepID=UPI00168B5F86|nr:L,D-transpeptidase family protein [Flavobacterium selenitireducens]MBD3582430.1 L,D-transpeptidase family protein [Flavobacterium selenitireducens]
MFAAVFRTLDVIGYCFRSEKPLPENSKIDLVVVVKSRRIMQVFENGNLRKTYRIALGKNPVGHKQFEGDFRTPEGCYEIDGRNPNSKFHKNLSISYPNVNDLETAQRSGKQPGGDIKIHGLRNGRGYRSKLHLLRDWTAGCIAVTNREIDELFTAVMDGAEIRIEP